MNNYRIKKEETRQKAQAFQVYEDAISWGEIIATVGELEKLAKRYGLIKEFKREGIL